MNRQDAKDAKNVRITAYEMFCHKVASLLRVIILRSYAVDGLCGIVLR